MIALLPMPMVIELIMRGDILESVMKGGALTLWSVLAAGEMLRYLGFHLSLYWYGSGSSGQHRCHPKSTCQGSIAKTQGAGYGREFLTLGSERQGHSWSCKQ
jgi:hypothetical protein